MRASHHFFHLSDKSQRAMFYRAHDKIAERNRHFFAIQNGPNPLTPAEIRRLAQKHPDRWGAFLGFADAMEQPITQEA
jgi:hypothetical protein